MGLFWKSDSDYIIEDIQDLVGRINRELLKAQDSLVANNGVSNNNVIELSGVCERLENLQNQVEAKMDQLSLSKQSKLMVSWIDGRYFPFAMWAMSYNVAVNRIRIALQKYANNI